MSNWSVTSNTFTALAGASISNQEVELTISPLNGHLLSASNFQIGGATETNDLLVPTSGTGIWQDGNVDSGVTKVKFEDNGTPNTGNNTVKATVTLDGFNAPSSSTIYNIDIDEVASNPVVDVEFRSFCFTYAWDHLPIFASGHVPDPNPPNPEDPWLFNNSDFISAGSPTMEIVAQTGAFGVFDLTTEYNATSTAGTPIATSSVGYMTHASNYLSAGQWNTMASLTVAAEGNNYFSELPSAGAFITQGNIGASILYQPYFQAEIVGDTYNSDGNLTQFTVTYKYHPPEESPLYPDPVDSAGNSTFCDLGLTTGITYNLVIVI